MLLCAVVAIKPRKQLTRNDNYERLPMMSILTKSMKCNKETKKLCMYVSKSKSNLR